VGRFNSRRACEDATGSSTAQITSRLFQFTSRLRRRDVAARLITEQLLKTVAALSEKGDADPELLSILTKAISLLNTTEAEARKLDLQKQRHDLKEEELRFTKAKFKTQLAEKFLQWVQNQSLVEVAKGGASHEDKIAAILRHMDAEERDGEGEAGA